MPQDRQMKLGAFLMTDGHHVAAWRHPKVRPDASVSLDHFLNLAKLAEAAKFDALFLADSNGVRERGLQALSHNSRAASFEPLTLLSALATVTQRIGLIATASTSFNEPFHLARKFASLDLISGGRAGWNVVTSSSDSEALNFNLDTHYAHADRYARAREFVAVTTGLWNTWEDDAFLRDQDSGLFFDPQKHHVLDHRGRYFKVRGPLNVPRSPQGHPVIVQAGSSAAGVDLAAETAEVVFTAQQTLADAQAFYADLKSRAETYGRDPDHIKIMPGIFPVVGRTEAEAQETFEALQSRIHPVVGLALLSSTLGGFDLTGYPLDGPLPDLPETNGPKSRQKLLIDLARREKLTIRELYLKIAGARGHWQLVGTAEQIVDRLEERFRKGGADGFNVMAPFLPGGLGDFIALVIPELRRRGLFRTDYEGRTLRENLGLPFPAHRARTAVPLQAAE
ncbi:LLM class flavin-dependent oxidoreductase [Methylobacterium pseudosasicola]|uniref:FMN-dependent oxidoreductase, nitrilotriacetate monooxygenase family n=1 Tax=Methylobacterium pseudosasicola TaxID=582667 RepID=A0A1I4Q655_9HYPH|nr:LLM class flavin-dependent oxidoreductase [Methylobacterium pseudosasicola]SFM35135.1 FMN-dependent oxidoreductase, nitrilotriacetate monooxygenase family [Methylobacterium pseudosasicola]